jgi:hypothetical protein
VARGGASRTTGVRVLCAAHNRYEAERVLGRAAVEAGKARRQLEEDMVAGLKRMGVTAADARHAVVESRGRGTTVEERMRAALGVLREIYARQKGWRCEEPQVACQRARGLSGREAFLERPWPRCR